MKSVLDAAHFADETTAIAYVEARLWPNGPVCPHCGTIGEASRSKGKTTRAGLWNCRACRKPFTVRMGTIFESSHVPLRVWLQAIYLISSSKKGISTRQIQRTLGGSMKTAWFMMHRIRLAMDEGGSGPLGGEGQSSKAMRLTPSTKKVVLLGFFTRNSAGKDCAPELIACLSLLSWSGAAALAPGKLRMSPQPLCAALSSIRPTPKAA
jgi:transposase-like protein